LSEAAARPGEMCRVSTFQPNSEQEGDQEKWVAEGSRLGSAPWGAGVEWGNPVQLATPQDAKLTGW